MKDDESPERYGWIRWPLPFEPQLRLLAARQRIDGVWWILPRPTTAAQDEWESITFHFMGDFETPPSESEVRQWASRNGFEKYTDKLLDFNATWAEIDKDNPPTR